MNAVFLDTVGLLALWDEADQWHAAALSAYEPLKSARIRFVTSNLVLAECGNAAARRPYRDEVNPLRMTLTRHGDLLIPSDEEWNEAWQAYDQRAAAEAGIVDQVSFVIMRRLGLRRAFTNDEHFRAAGFETLF